MDMTETMSARPDRLLEIYLTDHLAAATAGVALVRRCARSNATNGYGETLRRLAEEIVEDRRTLRGIVAELGFEESKAKNATAWLGEKVGRLKLNGQLRGYSPTRPSAGFWNSRRSRSASPGNWRCGRHSSRFQTSPGVWEPSI